MPTYRFTYLTAVAIALFSVAAANATDSQDQPQSPYFQIVSGGSDDASGDFFPLKSTVVKSKISGIIADVEVIQTYSNLGDKPIEAIYMFPASTRAAVHGMTMKIGDRTIKAVVKEKAKAKADYEKAKQENKRASLLEQHRPNVFQMSVANILPGDSVEVSLRYTELLVPVDKEYSFVFPTVVGPRYNGTESTRKAVAPPSFDANANWAANPYLTEGEPAPATFEIDISIDAGMPLSKLASESHQVAINYTGKTSADVQLSPAAGSNANRDFILKYRHAGETIDSGLILH